MVLAPERGGRVISLLLTGAAAAVVSALLTGLIRQYARRTRLLDVPNVRSSHQAPTPRGGGLAIVIVTALALGILGLSGALERHSALALAGALPVAGAGWLDDRHGLGAGTRAAVQVACASWTLLWLGTAGSAGSLEAGLPAGAVGLAVGVLGIVWLSNLYNFMDGIDGIAGGQAAATGAVMTFLLARGGDMGLALLAAVIAGASLGFLIWNWSPALIFMGDVGSGFLGFIFGTIAVAGAREGIASAGLASRCTLVAGDFFTEVPRGGDVYTIKDVIHNWDDARAITLLKNCRQAMAPEARLLLIERVIAPEHGPASALLDITVLVNTGAGERTEAEHRALLQAAGFTLTAIIPTPSGRSLIEGAPV